MLISYYIVSAYSHRYLANSATQESDDSHIDCICISQSLKRFNFVKCIAAIFNQAHLRRQKACLSKPERILTSSAASGSAILLFDLEKAARTGSPCLCLFYVSIIT